MRGCRSFNYLSYAHFDNYPSRRTSPVPAQHKPPLSKSNRNSASASEQRDRFRLILWARRCGYTPAARQGINRMNDSFDSGIAGKGCLPALGSAEGNRVTGTYRSIRARRVFHQIGKSFQSFLNWRKTRPEVKSLFRLAKHKLRQTGLHSEAKLTNLKLIGRHNHIVQIGTQ